jgi:hypothetical protein
MMDKEQRLTLIHNELAQYHDSCVYHDALATTPLPADVRHLVSLYRRNGHAHRLATLLGEHVYQQMSTIVRMPSREPPLIDVYVLIPASHSLLEHVKFNLIALQTARLFPAFSIPNTPEPHFLTLYYFTDGCMDLVCKYYLQHFHAPYAKAVVLASLLDGAKRGKLAQKTVPDAQHTPEHNQFLW